MAAREDSSRQLYQLDRRVPGRRRLWSEEVPFEVVRSPRVLDACRERGIDLLIAVRPSSAAGLGDTLAACADAGVRAGIWPMLDDRDGRWASASSLPTFATFTRRVLDRLDARGLRPLEIAIDLEPPFEEVRRLIAHGGGISLARVVDLGGLGRSAKGAPASGGQAVLTALVSDIRPRGIEVSAAVIPIVLADPGWEALLGTPVSRMGFDRVSPMLYTSIIEGWSRGVLRREDAVGFLAWGAAVARERFGARADVSLGAVGHGAFGDEPLYRSPEELAEDVAVALAEGVDSLTLLDLGGVLERTPIEAWLDALVTTPAASSPARRPRRVQAALAAARVIGRTAGGVASLVDPL